MSEQINDGGPAFPHGPLGDSITFDDGRTSHQWPACAGMSLRDWFAGQALQGILAGTLNGDKPENWAKAAYQVADAMLKARGGAK